MHTDSDKLLKQDPQLVHSDMVKVTYHAQRENLAYYPATESVAGVEFEVMNVVRIRIA